MGVVQFSFVNGALALMTAALVKGTRPVDEFRHRLELRHSSQPRLGAQADLQAITTFGIEMAR